MDDRSPEAPIMVHGFYDILVNKDINMNDRIADLKNKKSSRGYRCN